MKKFLIISTGGTFNKVYNPITGELQIDTTAKAVYQIAEKWLTSFRIETIIGKDSLEMDDSDRRLLVDTICNSTVDTIIVIHGTDTMDKSAEIVAKSKCDKLVVFTGAMVPYSVDPIEATANLASAIGYANGLKENGVYIAMNSIFGKHAEIIKDRAAGKFISAP